MGVSLQIYSFGDENRVWRENCGVNVSLFLHTSSNRLNTKYLSMKPELVIGLNPSWGWKTCRTLFSRSYLTILTLCMWNDQKISIRLLLTQAIGIWLLHFQGNTWEIGWRNTWISGSDRANLGCSARKVPKLGILVMYFYDEVGIGKQKVFM